MAGAKGYNSYRGRGPRWKIFLAVVLVLVIAAAASVIYLQQFIVYSADGRRQIDLPWQREEKTPSATGNEEDPPETPSVDVVLEPPEEEGPKETRAVSFPVQELRRDTWAEFENLVLADLSSGPYNAVAVRLKTSNGTIYFDSASAVSGAVDTAEEPGETAAALALMTSREGLHTIASMACLQDFKAANAAVEERGLKNTGGYIFYDGNNSLWLDPAKPGAREYVCALAKEIAELGFDELLLTDFGYPTEGKLNKIDYNTQVPLAENLDLLLDSLRTALEPYGTLLSVEVPEAVITGGPDETAGLDLSHLVGRVDRVYAVTTTDKAETLSTLVSQAAGADGKTEFVPELAVGGPYPEGSCLILPE